mmetsp:Transcript_46187/g.114897  ORF Transcript_46187/g.114897 Transcript_46187/m.114897 type:complete len:328 (+) Transcript_46187:2989-3972(+)
MLTVTWLLVLVFWMTQLARTDSFTGMLASLHMVGYMRIGQKTPLPVHLMGTSFAHRSPYCTLSFSVSLMSIAASGVYVTIRRCVSPPSMTPMLSSFSMGGSSSFWLLSSFCDPTGKALKMLLILVSPYVQGSMHLLVSRTSSDRPVPTNTEPKCSCLGVMFIFARVRVPVRCVTAGNTWSAPLTTTGMLKRSHTTLASGNDDGAATVSAAAGGCCSSASSALPPSSSPPSSSALFCSSCASAAPSCVCCCCCCWSCCSCRWSVYCGCRVQKPSWGAKRTLSTRDEWPCMKAMVGLKESSSVFWLGWSIHIFIAVGCLLLTTIWWRNV